MISLVDRILTIHQLLDKADVGHAFGGALALAYCTGEPRATRDIDINIFLPAEQVLREAIESELAPEILARHLYFVIRRAITGAPSAEDDPRARLELSNRIVAAISSITNEEVDDSDLLDVSDTPMLWGVKSLPGTVGGYKELESPSVRLSQSALLVNARNQPAIGHELNKELSTADSVDLLCSFVMNTGMNVLERGLSSVVSRGGTVRVLTTTYMGATQKKALDRLSALGAEVRISYDGTTTRLHAKSWLMKRRSGATTAPMLLPMAPK